MKKAIKRLVRGSDGRVHIVHIDTTTLQVITDLTGYKIINPGNTVIESLNPVQEQVAQETGVLPPSGVGNLSVSGEGYGYDPYSANQPVSSSFPPAPQMSQTRQNPTAYAPPVTPNMSVPQAPMSQPAPNNDMQGHAKQSSPVQGLHPAFQARAEGFLDAARQAGLDPQVMSGHRSHEEQQALYDQGRTAPGSVVTNAKPGQSYHNYGLGFDVAPNRDVLSDKNWAPEDESWNTLGKTARGMGLEWGGDWKSFKDMPHIQPPGLSLADLRGYPTDARGYPQLPPEVDLSIRDSFVPTPSPAPRGMDAKSLLAENVQDTTSGDFRPSSVTTEKPDSFAAQIYSDALALGFTPVQAELAAAQAALESGYGKSAPNNNMFGIKASDDYDGPKESLMTTEYSPETGMQRQSESFRAYDDPTESLMDYGDMMSRNFSDAWNAPTFDQAVEGLNSGRYGSYATDPNYSDKLASIFSRDVSPVTGPVQDYNATQRGLGLMGVDTPSGYRSSFSPDRGVQPSGFIGYSPSSAPSAPNPSSPSYSSVPSYSPGPSKSHSDSSSGRSIGTGYTSADYGDIDAEGPR